MTEITLQWDWNGNPETLLFFKILINYALRSQNEEVKPAIFLNDVRAREYSIQGLTKNTNYTVNMIAVGKNSKTAEYPPIPIATQENVNLTVTKVEIFPGPGTLNVTWFIPSEIETKEITGFRIQKRRKNLRKKPWTPINEIISKDDRSFELPVEPDVDFEIQVGTKLRSGDIQWSSSHVARSGQSGSPYIRQISADGNSVTIQWEKPFNRRVPVGQIMYFLEITDTDKEYEKKLDIKVKNILLNFENTSIFLTRGKVII